MTRVLWGDCTPGLDWAVNDALGALAHRLTRLTSEARYTNSDIVRLSHRGLEARYAALLALLGVLGFSDEPIARDWKATIEEHLDAVEAERQLRRIGDAA